MADWGVGGGGVPVVTDVITAGDSVGIAISPSGTSGVKGSWVELISAANNIAGDWNGFQLHVMKNGSGMRNHALDIGVGASGSEVAILPDFKCNAKNITQEMVAFIPLRVPGGVRVAARVAGNDGNVETLELQLIGVGAAFSSLPVFGSVDVMGESGGGNGVDVDPGGTANTKGSYVEIEASTDHHYKALMLGLGSSDNAGNATSQSTMDIAIGAASSEQIIIPDLFYNHSSQEITNPTWSMFVMDLAQGTRLSVRNQCTNIDAVDRLADVILYGFY